MRLFKRLFIFMLVACGMLLPVCALAVNVGEVAPDFTLESVGGEKVSLNDFKGQVVLLKLATTWCPTCKELSAEIQKAGEFLKEQNVAVLEVYV